MARTAGSARQQILDTASQLFLRESFRAVGIDTIVEQSGVAKMTLYRYFPSKDALIVAYLEQTNSKFWGWFEQAIAPYERQPRQQLYALYEALTKLATSPTCAGCTFQMAASEYPVAEQVVHKAALEHKQAVRRRLHDLATQAHAHDSSLLADQLLLLMDGAFAATRMFAEDSPAFNVGNAARILIDAQLPPTN